MIAKVAAASAQRDCLLREVSSLRGQLESASAQAAGVQMELLDTRWRQEVDRKRAEGAEKRAEGAEEQAAQLQAHLGAAKEQLDRVRAQQQLARGRFAQQGTLDGRVVSSIGTPAKAYAALGMSRRADGRPIPDVTTEFKKDLSDMSDRRLRELLQLAEPAISTVAHAFHRDGRGLLALLHASYKSERRSARQQVDLSLLSELPLVQDVVEAINDTNDANERQQLLSFLTRTFSNKELNSDDLGLDKVVSRRLFYQARAQSRLCGAGATLPKLDIIRTRVRAENFEAALRFICSPANMQVGCPLCTGLCPRLVALVIPT